MCVCGVQDTSRTDPRFVVGLTHGENREERGEVRLVSLAWRGATGIISAAGPWLHRCSVGALPAGGNAVWFPRLVLRLLPLTPFPSVHSFIIYRFLLLFSSFAGS